MNEFQQRIGVGAPCYAIGRTGPTRTRMVVADEGPRAGKKVGTQTDHKDGRVDASVFAPSIQVTAQAQEL